MSNEYSELEAAKAATNTMGTGAKSLFGILYNKSKKAVTKAYAEVTQPRSLEDQALKVVDAKRARKDRNQKLQAVATRIGGGIVANTVSGTLNVALGLAKGMVGMIDQATVDLANKAKKAKNNAADTTDKPSNKDKAPTSAASGDNVHKNEGEADDKTATVLSELRSIR